MLTHDAPDIYGYTIFCDDIRYEVDGKASFVGAYDGHMNIHTPFPATLPKFGFSIRLWQRIAIAEVNIAFRVYLPDDTDEKPSIEAKVDGPTIPSSPVPEAEHVVMKADLVATSLVLKAPGLIKVRAFRNGELYRLGSLVVAAAPPAAAPALDRPEQAA